MNVFLHGSDGQPPPAAHTVIVCPAAHMPNTEVPKEWVDRDNNPVTFPVVFQHGKAEVDDALGAYMVKAGIAQRSRLIVPSQVFA